MPMAVEVFYCTRAVNYLWGLCVGEGFLVQAGRQVEEEEYCEEEEEEEEEEISPGAPVV